MKLNGSYLAFLGALLCSAACNTRVAPNYVYQVHPVEMQVSGPESLRMGTGRSTFHLDGHFVWGGSAIRAVEDGRYYLIYSAPETGKYRFGDAWVLGSKMGLAVSERPDGGFRHLGFFYNVDGFRPDGSSWDSQTCSNPHLHRFGDKYYLYYCGSVDPGNAKVRSATDTLARRDRIQQNQKIGVLIFDTFEKLLAGDFERSDVPLLAPRTRVKEDNIVDPSPEGTVALPDNIITVNPSVVRRPSDGKYLLYFKGNIYDPYWRGIHGVALSDSPAGPFVPLDRPVFTLPGDDSKHSAEDPYVWYSAADGCFYAVFKDFTGHFTKSGPCLAIMRSDDGIEWVLPKHSLFMKKELILASGETLAVKRLERPQLLVDENGVPQVLYAACAIDDVNPRTDGGSFNVQIALTREKAE